MTSSSVCGDLIQEYIFIHSLSGNNVFRDTVFRDTVFREAVFRREVCRDDEGVKAARLLAAAIKDNDNIREIK